jgi:hypothetical protein
MKIKSTIVFIFLIAIRLIASCGSESCPIYHFHYNRQGGLHLRLYSEYINQDRLYLGNSLSSVGAVPEEHDEVSTLNAITAFRLQYGISDRFDLGFILPYVHREHSHIHHEDGVSQRENWNFSGLGDISVTGNYSLIVPSMNREIYLGISAGIKLPTGVTNAVNAGGEPAEVTLQPGTGSYDELIGANFRYPLFTIETAEKDVYSTIPLIFGITYKIAGNGTNDYKFGNTLLISAGTAYQFTNKAGLTLQLNFRNQDYADVGKTGEPRENTGGTWFYLSPGFNLSITDNLAFFGIFQLPVYMNVHGLQQVSAFNLQFGISADTSLF